DELVVVERAREVVVATAAERAHAFVRPCLCRPEHDHRRLAAPALELGVVAGKNKIRRAPRRGELEPVVPQLLLEQPACGRLVLGQQHRGRHVADGSSAIPHRPGVLCADFETKNPQAPGRARACSYKRPERTTPYSSHMPSTPETMKPMTEIALMPKIC